MRISDLGVRFVCGWEAFSATPYRDQSGHCTWGYGHCQRPGESPPASISQEAALALMASDLQPVEIAMTHCTRPGTLQSQFDALVSLAYNVGTAAVAQSHLVRLLNAGRIEDAGEEFLRWAKVRNPKTGALETAPGLLARRRAERAIFLGGLYNWDH